MALEPLVGSGRIRSRNEQAGPLQPASWRDSRIIFDHRRWACADAELSWTSGHHLILLTEQGRTAKTMVRFEGRTVYDGQDRPGALTFVPASVERQCVYRDADLVYSALWVDPTLQDELCADGSLPVVPSFVNQNDAMIAALLTSVRTDLARGHVPDTAYMEHLSALVLRRLSALHGSAPRPRSGGQLSRRALARLDDHIEANLGCDIALSDLAGLLDLPVDTFARRFKASTGQAPYAYVLERRIQRAEALLADRNADIAAIALALGFSSQSHFTATFRRLRGTTPRSYRTNFSPVS